MSDLRSLIAQVVDDAVARGVERAAIAEACGVLYSTFNRQINPNDNINFPIENLMPLLRITKDARVLEYLVSETQEDLHLALVRAPLADPRRMDGIAGLMTRFSNVITGLTQFGAGKLTRPEARRLIDGTVSELLAMRMSVARGKWQNEFELLAADKSVCAPKNKHDHKAGHRPAKEDT